MADVIAMYMVLDGKPLRLMFLYIIFLMACGIANIFVADVITTCCSIRRCQMLLPGGRWNSHCRVGEY